MQNNLKQCREGWWYELVFASNILLRISSNKYQTDPNYDGPYSTVSKQFSYANVNIIFHSFYTQLLAIHFRFPH